MKIQFDATLQGAACLKLDDDGSSVVKLTMDSTQMADVIKLVMAKGKNLKVSIEFPNG